MPGPARKLNFLLDLRTLCIYNSVFLVLRTLCIYNSVFLVLRTLCIYKSVFLVLRTLCIYNSVFLVLRTLCIYNSVFLVLRTLCIYDSVFLVSKEVGTDFYTYKVHNTYTCTFIYNEVNSILFKGTQEIKSIQFIISTLFLSLQVGKIFQKQLSGNCKISRIVVIVAKISPFNALTINLRFNYYTQIGLP